MNGEASIRVYTNDDSGIVTIADAAGWFPGYYDTEPTARHAITLDVDVVQGVVDRVCATRAITMDDLRTAHDRPRKAPKVIQRRAVVGMTVNLVLIHTPVEDNGPTQDADAVRTAVRDHIDGVLVQVRERRSLSRPSGEYQVVVLNHVPMSDTALAEGLKALELDVNGRPTS